jgi:hypothetical protein
MLRRHVSLEVEAVEQGVLRHRPLAHLRFSPEDTGRLNQLGSARSTAFFNKIGAQPPSKRYPANGIAHRSRNLSIPATGNNVTAPTLIVSISPAWMSS